MRESQIHFLKDIFTYQWEMRNALDRKASFLLSISGIIFVLSMMHLEKISFKVIAFASIISCLIALWTITLPFKERRRKAFHLMSFLGFSKMTPEEYYQQILETIETDEKIIEEYIRNVYALATRSLEPKSKLIRIGNSVLTLGLIIGGILIIFGV